MKSRKPQAKTKSRAAAAAALESLRAQTDMADRDQILRLLAKPKEERTHFLRVRQGHRGGTAL
jgi:hypothetical protein